MEPAALKMSILKAVAAENIDAVPDDYSDATRFVVAAIRAAARRTDLTELCAFVYSEAAGPDTSGHGFSRIGHMQDGHGAMSGSLIATNREANNGMARGCAQTDPAAIMDELDALGLNDRCTVIWDPGERVATIYLSGISAADDHIRSIIPFSDADLTQDDVCTALDRAYAENLCNPSGHTARLWVKGKLVERAEDEIERHVKGQLDMFFAGRPQRVKILPQTAMTAGRADLLFLQRSTGTGPRAVGVLELKVLRGPAANDYELATEGLSQGYAYRKDVELPFATLALYDVADPPSDDLTPLTTGQKAEHLAAVRMRRFALYNSPKAWRDAGGASA